MWNDFNASREIQYTTPVSQNVFLESTVYLIPPASENLIGLVISSFSKSPLWQRENEDLQQQTEFISHKPVLMKPSGGGLGHSVFSIGPEARVRVDLTLIYLGLGHPTVNTMFKCWESNSHEESCSSELYSLGCYLQTYQRAAGQAQTLELTILGEAVYTAR